MKFLVPLIVGCIILILLVIVVCKYVSISKYFWESQKNSKGELLKIIIQVLGGSILLFGTLYSLRIADAMNENNKLVEKGNIAERFKNAISMLENENSSTCLGGIYALNEIAKDNSEYREQVFNILVTLVNAKTEKLLSWKDIPKPDRFSTKPSIEIQTIVKLLFSKNNQIYKGFKATFENAKLYGGDFSDLNFSYSTFKNVEIQNCFFQKTWFVKCIIYNSDFTLSDCNNAYFTGSDIRNGIFACSNFYFARLDGCFMQHVDFSCSMIDANFDGSTINNCVFDGVEIVSIWNKATFNGTCIDNPSYKGIVCDSIIARGIIFNRGLRITDFLTNMTATIGEKGNLNINNIKEPFPTDKLLKYWELIINDNSSEKFYCHRLRSIKNGNLGSSGWIFKDLGEFTKTDSEDILKSYNDAVKMVEY